MSRVRGTPRDIGIAKAYAVGGPLRWPTGDLSALGSLFRGISCHGSARGRGGARLGWGGRALGSARYETRFEFPQAVTAPSHGEGSGALVGAKGNTIRG